MIKVVVWVLMITIGYTDGHTVVYDDLADQESCQTMYKNHVLSKGVQGRSLATDGYVYASCTQVTKYVRADK